MGFCLFCSCGDCVQLRVFLGSCFLGEERVIARGGIGGDGFGGGEWIRGGC